MEFFDLSGTGRTSDDRTGMRRYHAFLIALLSTVICTVGAHMILMHVHNTLKAQAVQVDHVQQTYNALCAEITRLKNNHTQAKNGRVHPTVAHTPTGALLADYLTCIAHITPDTVRIEKLTYEAHKKIVLEATAYDIAGATAFARTVQQAGTHGMFKNGMIKSITEIRSDKKERSDVRPSDQPSERNGTRAAFVFETPLA